MSLEDDYLDWFFLSNFGKGVGYWKNLSEDKLRSILIIENEKESQWWKNWADMFKKMFSK